MVEGGGGGLYTTHTFPSTLSIPFCELADGTTIYVCWVGGWVARKLFLYQSIHPVEAAEISPHAPVKKKRDVLYVLYTHPLVE